MAFFYHATIRVDGILWYHTSARPESMGYIHLMLPVFHNYGFVLALAGYVADPDVGYSSIGGKTLYKQPLDLFHRFGIYSYPLYTVKAVQQTIFLSAKGEGFVEAKGKGRFAYPDIARNTVLLPGSILETLIISEYKLPSRLITRIGSKRAGTLHIRLYPVTPKVAENSRVTHYYNLGDVVETSGGIVIINHPAGDIAFLGTASKAYIYSINQGTTRRKTITLPALKYERSLS